MAEKDDTLPDDEHTASSASLCISPGDAEPLCASTPCDKQTNGYAKHDVVDGNDRHDKDDNYNTLNGNVHVKIVSASTNNMDVLSGGESDTADTLSRRNNNSISSHLVGSDTLQRRGAGGDVTYYVAKELLMTERTYKRDLELVTVTWSGRVGNVMGAVGSDGAALARACLALEPLALPAGALLARLDRTLAAASPHRHQEMEEPEYKKIAELLCDYLTSTYDAYMSYVSGAGAAVAQCERARRRGGAASREACQFDGTAPLPLACLLLRPLHRLLHYQRLAHELWSSTGSKAARAALQLAGAAADAARAELPHVENHAALCQLQRDITGYDKLLMPGREFIRLGCVYKHSSKGLLQRMLFLFSDLMLVTSKTAGGQFRVHLALPLHRLSVEPADLTNSLTITGEGVSFVLSMSSEGEYSGWRHSLERAVAEARDRPADLDLELAHDCEDNEESSSSGSNAVSASSALAQVCWHRAASLPRDSLHLAFRTQLSGYLLRKFKNSHGWQKLWVVFAMFSLYFYKSWQDAAALASLPLLGYTVGPPATSDGIDKEFVFKLQFKNHVYFFRADSQFTYNRWTEVLQTPSMQSHHN